MTATTTSLDLLKGKSVSTPPIPPIPPVPPKPSVNPLAAKLVEQGQVTTAKTADVATPVADTEDDDIIVDPATMTVQELDALVKDHAIEVPLHWWKKEGADKKMTAPEKKDWLNEKFDDADPEAAPEAVAPETPYKEIVATIPKLTPEELAAINAVPDKAVADTLGDVLGEVAVKSKLKAGVPATTTQNGEVLDPDDMSNAIHEIENLKEKDALEVAAQLANQADFTYFKLGGVLALIQGNKWFAPYDTFKNYVEKEHGMHYRKAMYIVGIYNHMVKAEIPWSKVKHLGWTKMSVLSPVLTLENLDVWVNTATHNKVDDLSLLVKNAQTIDTGEPSSHPDTGSAPVIMTKTFKLHTDQKETVELALAKAKEMGNTTFDTVALEYMSLDFLGTGGKSKPVKLHLQLQELGLEAALDAFGGAYPNANLQVDMVSE